MTNNLFCFGDTHAGCQLAILPPEGITLDNGGTYLPSEFQRKMWGMWREMWDVWLPEATDGEPFASCHMGDSLDGVHHGSTSQITHNLNDQHKIALAVLKPVVEASKDGYYHIRGTGAHVGDAAMHEERLAQELGAIPNRTGQYARYQLWKNVGNALIQAMHHIGTTSRTQSESVAPHAELIECIVESGRQNQPIPDVVIRGHRHRHIETKIPTWKGHSRSIVCPGWQGKTPFVFKIGARQSEPQFGGVLLHWSEKRHELFVREKVWSLEREQPE